jgi:hypothetical protein
MKHSSESDQQHAVGAVRSSEVEILPLEGRNPGVAFLRRETETNRKSERWLILYGSISLVLVAVLITVRLVFFS